MAGGPSGSGQTVGVLNLLSDLAFNLLIFFVVCASTEPEKGRPDEMPSPNKEQTEQKAPDVEVAIKRTTVEVNGVEVAEDKLVADLKEKLAGKTKREERLVIVKSTGKTKDTPYRQWIRVTGLIKQAGAVVVLQVEEEKEVGVQ